MLADQNSYHIYSLLKTTAVFRVVTAISFNNRSVILPKILQIKIQLQLHHFKVSLHSHTPHSPISLQMWLQTNTTLLYHLNPRLCQLHTTLHFLRLTGTLCPLLIIRFHFVLYSLQFYFTLCSLRFPSCHLLPPQTSDFYFQVCSFAQSQICCIFRLS